MTMELWRLAEHANPETDASNPQLIPGLTADLCAALQPVIVLCGTVPRFYLGEFKWVRPENRTPPEKGPNMPPEGWTWYVVQVIIGVVFWLGGLATWLCCSLALHSKLWKDGVAPDDNMRATDQIIATLIVWIQALYPAVSVMEFVWTHALGSDTGDTYSSALSFAKDLCFGTLDVLTKGGLALYCASRSVSIV